MTTTDLALAGHAGAFPMSAEARELIIEYLARARAAMGASPAGDETVRDVEAAIGDQLQRILDDGGEIDGNVTTRVLEQFGPISPDEEAAPAARAPFLCRIVEGRQISGLCLGLATRADVRVDWLRSIAVVLGLFSGGLLVVAYLVALLFAPRIRTTGEYRRALEADRRRKQR